MSPYIIDITSVQVSYCLDSAFIVTCSVAHRYVHPLPMAGNKDGELLTESEFHFIHKQFQDANTTFSGMEQQWKDMYNRCIGNVALSLAYMF